MGDDANHLIDATSPYLLQHAHNPVDWYPWGEEALELARSQDRPLFISIGYSACHWCHVMAHESFEDRGVAGLLNRAFVSIKVDREERPDLDAIYMDAVQAMSGSGGWPMTIFATPTGEPFFAGTYLPPEDRAGMPSFRRLVEAIAEAWRDRPQQLRDQGAKLAQALGRAMAFPASADPLTASILDQAASKLATAFDANWGGFGTSPKFPQPMILEFLIGRHLAGDERALAMVTTSLDRMAAGGLHDQLGGGFHRYSTDRRWHVPHFEKMLYDNAQLARVYLHAFQITGRADYALVARRTLDYLLREMRHPQGGFFSSQDADSEGEEGRYFVWSLEQVLEAAPDHGQAVASYWGASVIGNWEGTNVLWAVRPLAEVAAAHQLDEAVLGAAVEATRARLLERRADRIRPGTDDKILAAWNGLAIVALAEAGRVLEEAKYIHAAVKAAEFVTQQMGNARGLARSWRGGRRGGQGFLEDHALLAAACLAIYETTFETRWVEASLAFARDLIERFADPDGGFFQTPHEGEKLVVKPKDLFDNAVPAGNSVAAEVLLRLARLTGDTALEGAGVSALRAARDLMLQSPAGFGHALSALALHLEPAQEVAILGPLENEATRHLIREVHRRHRPLTVLAAADPSDPRAQEVIPLLAGRGLVEGRPAAYVCEHFACLAPVTSPTALADALDATGLTAR